MVRVLFLGSGGWVTPSYRSYQCIFIVSDSGRVLVLDCGCFDARHYSIYGDLLRDIIAIVITHVHGDHVLGLPSLLFYMKYSNVSSDIKLLVLDDYRSYIEDLIRYVVSNASYKLEVCSIKPGINYSVGGFNVRFIEVEHVVRSVGCRVSVDGRYIGYSGDTRLCSRLFDIARDVDLLICEATLPEGMEERAYQLGHLTVKQAVEIAEEANVKYLVLTHVGYNICNTVKVGRFKRPIIWASDNLIIDL